MRNSNANYEAELKLIYDDFEKKVADAKSLDEILEVGISLQKKMEELNIRFRLWDDSKGYDYDSIYYTANFIVERCSLPDVCSLTTEDTEERKKLVAGLLFHKIDESEKRKIHVIEPHPDDALGSASGLCYSNGAYVTLHTICRVLDDRDEVCLEKETFNQYKSIRRNPNIVEQRKYFLDDLHWNTRSQSMDLGYKELLESDYIVKYGSDAYDKLSDVINDIMELAIQDDAYVAFPLGIEHPMHMLVAYACIEQVKKHGIDLDKVMIYVDHPYDYQNVGTGRIQRAKEYMQSELDIDLCRCDDVSIHQSILKDIITDLYGEKHYGEFDGSLENTYCSYFINYTALSSVKAFLRLHVNNILFITDQAKPFKKTGGSGEVVYVLCKTLQDYVNDVRIMMPKYSGNDVPDSEEIGSTSFIYNGNTETIGNVPCKIEERRYNGLTYYLLDIDGYFENTNPVDTGEHGKIYAVFCDVVMQKALNCIDYVPSVLHCNDWQTAMIPMLKKTKYRYYRPNLKVVYTIHFYGYRGIFKKNRIMEYVGLDEEKCKLCVACSRDCPLNKVDLLSGEDLDKLNVTPSQMSFMKAGIEFADVVSTVSKGYAKEIQNYPDFANSHVIGIRNGVRQQKYEFAKESGFVDIDIADFQPLKRKNKDVLQKKLGLERDFHIPLICMVSRLSTVKGIDVVKNIIHEILAIPAQLVIIGDDDDKIERPYATCFSRIEKENAGKFAYREFREELEYQTYAGADILLMPSLSEACGTTQMLAMQYGVVPIVSMIPAFGDTVLDYKNRHKKEQSQYWDRGVGFFAYKDDCWVLLEVIKKAIEIYHNEDHSDNWIRVAQDCMRVDFGWKNRSILEYMKIYNEI